MKKDQIIILKNRGLISISGNDSKDFLQNIITNDIFKVSKESSIFSALLTPQGKYLYEFFIIKSDKGYFLDCNEIFTDEIINNLEKYKLKSNVEFKNISSNYVVGIINAEKFKEIQLEVNKDSKTIIYRDCPLFIDPREDKLGARILSPLEKLYFTIKKLNLNIIEEQDYHSLSYELGIPENGLENLKDQLFGLEANFEILNAIDFKKGCYIGQENTARMKLKNKLRRKLMPIKTSEELNVGDDIFFDKSKIGKVLINKPFPFGLIKMYEPNYEDFKDKEITINGKKCKV
jgi:folate-binding protein YgfZ